MKTTLYRRAFIILILALWFQYTKAQTDVSFTFDFDTTEVSTYRFTGHGKTQTDFRMPFAGHKIYNPQNVEMYKGKEVLSVSLIYTDYPRGTDFSALNIRRILALYMIQPELFGNKDIKWNMVKQTNCNGITCYDRFHGFAVTFRDSLPRFKENSEMREMRETIATGETKDSTIYNVMNRNDDWKNMLVISDLTASMSPYIAELLLWFKLNNSNKRVSSFVFFNDGDLKSTAEKEIGSTGGIYMGEADDLEKILGIAFQAMSRGYGGDMPENDVEAILTGMDNFEDFDEVVLIADNKSQVRDLELATKLGKPVRVVLCGTEKGILTDYLELALNSGGSVHTIKEDIKILLKNNEGYIVEIGKIKYKIEEGKLIKLTEN